MGPGVRQSVSCCAGWLNYRPNPPAQGLEVDTNVIAAKGIGKGKMATQRDMRFTPFSSPGVASHVVIVITDGTPVSHDVGSHVNGGHVDMIRLREDVQCPTTGDGSRNEVRVEQNGLGAWSWAELSLVTEPYSG